VSARRRVDLSGRVAVVTGAGSGIGRAIALRVARGGAVVHVADLDEQRAGAVTAEIAAAGGRASAHAVDVTDPAAVEALAAGVFAAHGGVDLLFNNAGVGHAGAVADTPLEDWRRIVEVNLMGVVHGVHAFVPRLLAQGRPAHIVNTASMAGLVASAGLVPYCTSKFAVVGLSEALDLEIGPQGVRVTALCPGIINTDIVRATTTRGAWGARQEKLTRFYATRGTSPDVVAAAALDAVARGLVIVPTPRYQVLPAWLLTRYAPPLGRAVARATVRLMGPR
jgi:NAD(P)-dependent dehydrogenase (short-subunit alcohol dehydrogenase family)